MKLSKTLVSALAVGFALGAHAFVTNEFIVADGSFHEAANWSSNAVPDSTARARVSSGTAYITSDVTVNKLGVGVTGNGTVVQTGGNVLVTAVNTSGDASSFFLSGADWYGEPVADTMRNALYHLAGGTVDVQSHYCHIGQNRITRGTSEGVLRITGGSFTARRWTAIGRFTEFGRGHQIGRASCRERV